MLIHAEGREDSLLLPQNLKGSRESLKELYADKNKSVLNFGQSINPPTVLWDIE